MSEITREAARVADDAVRNRLNARIAFLTAVYQTEGLNNTQQHELTTSKLALRGLDATEQLAAREGEYIAVQAQCIKLGTELITTRGRISELERELFNMKHPF